eukprot:403377086
MQNHQQQTSGTTGPHNLPRSKINNQYILKERIGSGSFGQIYRGVSIHLTALSDWGGQSTQKFGFPKVYWYGREGDFNLMVLELLGKNLDETLKYCGRRFSLETVLHIADQIDFIHRDIKPENFCLGYGTSKQNQVYMIDLGLAKRYRDQKHKLHIPQTNHRGLTGTARYASINAHLGVSQSRRDDMESIGYLILYLLRGELPWQGVKAQTKHEKYQMIMERKMSLTSEMLCQGLPDEFQSYLQSVMDLGFEEKPNYERKSRLEKKKKTEEHDKISDAVIIEASNKCQNMMGEEHCQAAFQMSQHNHISSRMKLMPSIRIDVNELFGQPVIDMLDIFENELQYQIDRDNEKIEQKKRNFLEDVQQRLSKLELDSHLQNNDFEMSVESQNSEKLSEKYNSSRDIQLDQQKQRKGLDVRNNNREYHNSFLLQEENKQELIQQKFNGSYQYSRVFLGSCKHGDIDNVLQKQSNSEIKEITSSSSSQRNEVLKAHQQNSSLLLNKNDEEDDNNINKNDITYTKAVQQDKSIEEECSDEDDKEEDDGDEEYSDDDDEDDEDEQDEINEEDQQIRYPITQTNNSSPDYNRKGKRRKSGKYITTMHSNNTEFYVESAKCRACHIF